MGEHEQGPVPPPDLGGPDAVAPARPVSRDLPPQPKDLWYAEDQIVIDRDDDKA
jgi:hypothetical protein